MNKTLINLEILKKNIIYEMNFLPTDILFMLEEITILEHEKALFTFILSLKTTENRFMYNEYEKIITYFIFRISLQKELINRTVNYFETNDKRISQLFSALPSIVTFINMSLQKLLPNYDVQKFEITLFDVYHKTVNSIAFKKIDQFYHISFLFYQNLTQFILDSTLISKKEISILNNYYIITLIEESLINFHSKTKKFPYLRGLRIEVKTEYLFSLLSRLKRSKLHLVKNLKLCLKS